ncbi:MAG: hypothetical protein M3Z84_07960, partial [Actinomycetota bacterium]|nr:hypothetical protein [Actinomycetota bacterium]
PCPDPNTGANPPDGTTIAGPVVVNDKGSGCFLSGVTVNGDVVVSAGAFVDIEFSRVNGSVSVRGPGSATVIGKSTVTGAVSAQGNDFVDLFGARVGGEVNESGAKFGTSFVCDSTIGSTLRDLQSTDATFPATIGDPGTGFECGPNTVAGDLVVLAGREGATIRRNTVHGSIIVNANHTSSPIVVAANTVDKQILCSGNTPAPTGGANTASAKVGQCARL